MDDSADTPDAAEDLLQEAEARALAILNETGFGQFADRLDSDDAWRALHVGKKAGEGPQSSRKRARRAAICLTLVEWIRAAALDLDFDAVIRHSINLGSHDRDLVGRAQRDAIAERQRLANVKKGIKARRRQRTENHEEWTAEEARQQAAHPGVSDRVVAAMVAEACDDAKVETVRKALREARKKAAKKKRSKNI